MLRPLRETGKVALKVTDPKMRRLRRLKTPVLMIMEIPGTEEPMLLFAIPGMGAEVMKVRSLKMAPLVRVGLSAIAARLLNTELRKLYEV